MSIPYRQVIEWENFREKKPPRRCGPCLFSDGIVHRVGWWSESQHNLMLANADGTNSVVDHSGILVWAKLPNIVADIKEFFAKNKMVR